MQQKLNWLASFLFAAAALCREQPAGAHPFSLDDFEFSPMKALVDEGPHEPLFTPGVMPEQPVAPQQPYQQPQQPVAPQQQYQQPQQPVAPQQPYQQPQQPAAPQPQESLSIRC
ncbi:hypothetical protein ACSR9E_14770 [Citrobacter koseri]|uniref:hypothetical protein n=1 Tax=Citrobacter koseri TaxID=545 RepID=UPI0040419229